MTHPRVRRVDARRRFDQPAAASALHLLFQLAPTLLLAFKLAGAAFGPSLMRFLTPEDASHVAMWAARLVVSYLQSPSDDLDPGREDTARHLVVTYLLPGLEPAA